MTCAPGLSRRRGGGAVAGRQRRRELPWSTASIVHAVTTAVYAALCAVHQQQRAVTSDVGVEGGGRPWAVARPTASEGTTTSADTR